MILAGIVLPTDCQRVDIAFILDGSGSVYDTIPPVWKTQIDLLEKVINNLNIGPDDVRVALVTYGDTARVEWTLDRYYDKPSILEAIRRIQFSGGRSNIQAALLKAWHDVFSGSPGDRPDVADVIVTFSDGIPTVNVESTPTTAEDIKASGIWMSAVALGRYPSWEKLAYLSNIQRVYDENQLANQRIFSSFVAKLREGIGQTPTDPCISNPCMNQGICSSSENPYGWGYYCVCPTGDVSGGRLCQISKPCSSCPPDTWRCFRSISNDKGRFCFDRRYRLLD